MKPIATKIRELILLALTTDGPTRPFCDIAEEFGVSKYMVHKVAKDNGIVRKRGGGSPAWGFKKQTVTAVTPALAQTEIR